MLRCIDLAKRGAMYTSPNPQVGSVVVHEGVIVGEGYHSKLGAPHAEVEAIRSVSDANVLKKSTLYVNLEPCSHHGRTPPCADLILEHKIPRVVVANVDPNPSVSGKGLERLRSNGVEVITGVCEAQATTINRPFFHHQIHGRPYYLAKWARTADGFMGRLEGSSGSRRISSDIADRWVHQLRAESDAILIGSRTANLDDPLLTTRLVDGPAPIRVIIDPQGDLRDDLRLFQDKGRNIVLGNESKIEGNTEFLRAETDLFLQLDQLLLDNELIKILVEGGAETLVRLYKAGRMDECVEIISPNEWTEGIPAPIVKGEIQGVFDFGPDRAFKYLNPELE